MAVDRLVASKLDKSTLFRHLRLDGTYNADELPYIQSLQRSAIEYICDQCAIDEAEVDKHEDLAVAVLMIVSDLYDRRDLSATNGYTNRTVETILAHHDRNFLGATEEATDASG